MIFKLTNASRSKTFIIDHPENSIEIKKIILVPLFSWTIPDEWAARMHKQELGFEINGTSVTGSHFNSCHSIIGYNNPYLFQPVFNLLNPINLNQVLLNKVQRVKDYPINVTIKLLSSIKRIDFDIIFVYDESSK